MSDDSMEYMLFLRSLQGYQHAHRRFCNSCIVRLVVYHIRLTMFLPQSFYH